MRFLPLLALLAACGACNPPQKGAVSPPAPPAAKDAAARAPGTVHAACAHLCGLPCPKWCPSTPEACEAGMANLVQSGITVKLDCLAGAKTCDDTVDCAQ